jgi:hypothetical protein
VEVEAAGDVLGDGGVDGLGHLEHLGVPVVLPARFGPEQTLVADSEHHHDTTNIYYLNIQFH